jgi:hypothetical protein
VTNKHSKHFEAFTLCAVRLIHVSFYTELVLIETLTMKLIFLHGINIIIGHKNVRVDTVMNLRVSQNTLPLGLYGCKAWSFRLSEGV